MATRFQRLVSLALPAVFASCNSLSSESGSSGDVGTGFESGEGGASVSSNTGPGDGGSIHDVGGGGGGRPDPCATCTVIAALPHASKPTGLAIDDEHVYWTTESGLVMQSDKAGMNVVVLAAKELEPTGIAAQGGFVYWGLHQGTTLRRAPIGGGEVVDLGPSTKVRAIAVDGATLYFAGDDGLGAVPIGGLPEGVDETTLDAPGAVAIAVNTDGVYWADAETETVRKADLSLVSATELGSGTTPAAIAVDATRVYWTLSSSSDFGSVFAASTDGTSQRTLANHQAEPQAIAVDAERVFWANSGDGTVRATPIEGGPITVIAVGQGAMTSLAVDATDVYWTDATSDAVVKAPK